jgi:branched-chain amino acid transport system substrate-binding protein
MKTATFSTVLGDISFPKPGDIKQRVMGYYKVENGKWVMTHRTDAAGKLVKLDSPVPLDQ